MPDDLPSRHYRGCPRQKAGESRPDQLHLRRVAFLLLTAVDLPIVSWVAEATEEVPLSRAVPQVEMSMVRELLSSEEIHVAEAPSDSPAMSIGETTPEFLNACCRLLICWTARRTFLSEQPDSARNHLPDSAGTGGSPVARSSKHSEIRATGRQKRLRWITANYAKPLLVEDLAQLANMGVSTLHHHFRALTSMSPLRFQKQLRLQSARSLMLSNGLDAASAALRWATKALRQFNREYSRFFGQPPMRDIRALLSPVASKLELVGRF